MNFIHEFVDLPKINCEDTPNGRFYITPRGDSYQSVTTFLSKFSDTKWLDEWIERVGEDRANRTSTQAKKRGTAVHGILEQYVLNNPNYALRHMPNNIQMAMSIARILSTRASIIKGVEIGLWSDNMMIAGRADMLAEFDNILSIVDFKTSKYKKNEDDIRSYFLQCTLYAMMVEELTDLVVPNIVVMIGVDHEDAQLFIKQKDQYVDEINHMILELAT